MAIKRGDLVDAAKDLNKVLDLDPAIDVSKSVEEIRRDLEEASRLLSEDDALEDNTRAVVAALRGKEEVEKADAPAEKKAKGGGRPKGSKNKEKDAAAAAPKKAAGAPRGRPRESGPYTLGEFKPVREGTKYQELLKLVDAGKTVDQIATSYKVGKTDILWYFRYPLRKHGIDHRVSDDGKIEIVLPEGKTLADCVAARAAA